MDEEYLDEAVQEFEMSEDIMYAVSEWLEVEEGTRVVGIAVPARLEDTESSGDYYEAFVLPNGLYPHAKIGLMYAGKEIAADRLNETVYKDVLNVGSAENKQRYAQDLMEALSADEMFENLMGKFVDYFNFHKYTPQVVSSEVNDQGFFHSEEEEDSYNDDEGEGAEFSEERKITVAFKKAENRIISDGVMIIHVVEIETNASFYFYKQIPEASPSHSQKQLWELGCQAISESIEEF